MDPACSIEKSIEKYVVLKCCLVDIKNGYWYKLVFITYEKAKLRI